VLLLLLPAATDNYPGPAAVPDAVALSCKLCHCCRRLRNTSVYCVCCSAAAADATRALHQGPAQPSSSNEASKYLTWRATRPAGTSHCVSLMASKH
jgi:hypothetical protein